MTAEHAVFYSFIVCALGALLTLFLGGNRRVAGWTAFVAAGVSSLLVLYGAGKTLVSGPEDAVSFLALPRYGLDLRLYVDGLSALFLGLIAVIAVLSAFYSIAYMESYPEYGVRRYYPWFLLFVGAMYGIVSITDTMVVFFLFWQIMTFASYALVRFEYKRPENVRAAWKYLIMMQIACVLVMLGAAMLAPAPGGAAGGEAINRFDFDVLSAHLPMLLRDHSAWAAVAFALFLAGFGIKLGMWPFGQIWLPDAHPAAPSPVSALLSGVMIKTGVYGVARCFLWLVPAAGQKDYPSQGWGVLIAVLGTITLFSGTMQALKQEQSKRLLAFHSIGQVGYILLGLGTCLALMSPANPAVMAIGVIGLCGALFHTLNHGLFKSLLFMNAGSMLHATGTQDLNKLGGLMRYMPLTALTALVASFSISGVPLFNGFASKWILYSAAIQGGSTARYLPACALVAILTSALTLASFIKFFGVSFLSRTSARVKERVAQGQPLEVGPLMQAPQLILAACCLFLGVVPGVAVHIIGLAIDHSRQGLGVFLANAPMLGNGPWGGLHDPQGKAVWIPLAIVLVFACLFAFVHGITRLGGATRKAVPPWLCGYALETDANRYGAHNFYGEIKRYFRWIGGSPAPQPTRPQAESAVSTNLPPTAAGRTG
ncbi:MAG: peroxiredoxin family protein [Candidatus Omnitrophica bacterium]|nr:peroxiredoxin family protein [Candidatus Omnitrophota bacterium]